TWIRSADFNQKIDAAETLCVIGERELGIRTLNQIIKNSEFGFDIRLEAAQTLERANEIEAAAKAYRILLCDSTFATEEQWRAARYFDEDNVNRSEIAWQILFPQFVDDAFPLKERIIIGKTLLGLSKSEWFEYEKRDVLDEFLSILEAQDTPSIE